MIPLPPPSAAILFWSAALVALFAQVMVLRAAVAGRTPAASASSGGKVRELLWIVLPAVTLVVLLWFTWRAVERRAEGAAPVTVSAIVQQGVPS